jgi:hypothetical protein
MAITATSQTLFDGERIAIMKFYATMSATENETNVVKVNPSNLAASNAGGACDAVSILKVTALTHGLEVQMNWVATAPVVIEVIPQNNNYTQDYTNIGGLTNNSGAGKTGSISFTTLDGSAGDTYTVILEMQKHYVNLYQTQTNA